MKNFALLLAALCTASLLSLTSCSSSKNSQAASRSMGNGDEVVLSENDQRSNLQLVDMLRKVPGVQVMGSGNNARITIRGASTLNASNEPLFVLDGNPVGNDFSLISSAVNPQEVDKISVVKGSDASFYGARGGNGVIIIKTKQ